MSRGWVVRARLWFEHYQQQKFSISKSQPHLLKVLSWTELKSTSLGLQISVTRSHECHKNKSAKEMLNSMFGC